MVHRTNWSNVLCEHATGAALVNNGSTFVNHYMVWKHAAECTFHTKRTKQSRILYSQCIITCVSNSVWMLFCNAVLQMYTGEYAEVTLRLIKTRSSAIAKSTARPSCLLVYLMTFIGRQSTYQRPINHFYVTGHESYRIPQNNAKLWILRRSRSFKVTDFGTNRKPIYDFLLAY